MEKHRVPVSRLIIMLFRKTDKFAAPFVLREDRLQRLWSSQLNIYHTTVSYFLDTRLQLLGPSEP